MTDNHCYAYPQYWDLAFRSETKVEADFIVAACEKFAGRPVHRLLEPGCGGGRLVVEMVKRGYDMTAFDLSQPMVDYVQKRLRRRGTPAKIYVDDMTSFKCDQVVDAAFCTFNTFRHLTTEASAKSHLESVANCLRPGGIYILGFHIIPLDADEDATERWTAKHGNVQVTTTLKVVDFNRRRRVERLRFALNVKRPQGRLRIESEYPYRLYTDQQFRRLLASVPAFELVEVFDFWYDIDDPVPFDDQISDAVFILRRR